MPSGTCGLSIPHSSYNYCFCCTSQVAWYLVLDYPVVGLIVEVVVPVVELEVVLIVVDSVVVSVVVAVVGVVVTVIE